MAKGKYFRLPETLEKEFSHICAALGLSQNKVLVNLVEQFVKAHRGQLTLNSFLQPQTVHDTRREVLIRLAEFDIKTTLMWMQDLVYRQERGENIKPVVLGSVAEVLKTASALKQLCGHHGLANAVESLTKIENLAERFLERQLSMAADV